MVLLVDVSEVAEDLLSHVLAAKAWLFNHIGACIDTKALARVRMCCKDDHKVAHVLQVHLSLVREGEPGIFTPSGILEERIRAMQARLDEWSSDSGAGS